MFLRQTSPEFWTRWPAKKKTKKKRISIMKRHPQHILTHTETETWTNITVQGFTTFWPREQYASRSIASSATTHSDTTGVTRYALHCYVTLLEISDGAWEDNMCTRNYVCTVFTIWIWKVSVKQPISRSFLVIIIVSPALVCCIYKLFVTPPIGTLKRRSTILCHYLGGSTIRGFTVLSWLSYLRLHFQVLTGPIGYM